MSQTANIRVNAMVDIHSTRRAPPASGVAGLAGASGAAPAARASVDM